MRQIALFIFVVIGSLSAFAQSAPPKSDSEEKTRDAGLLLVTPSYEQAVINKFNSVASTSKFKGSREHPDSVKTQLKSIADQIKNAAPQSYAAQFLNYQVEGKSEKGFQYLDQAYLLNPSPDLFDDKLAEAVIRKNQAQITEFVNKIDQKPLFNKAVIVYNRNALNSVEQNGILITYGYEDTYPIIVLQQKEKLRTDVKIVCIDWLKNENYYLEVKELLHLKSKSYINELTFIEEALTKSNPNVYLSLTLPPYLIKSKLKELYCTGLALKYSKSKFNNIEILKENFDTKFDKTPLFQADKINRNYLLPLGVLEKYYEAQGLNVELERIRGILLRQNINKTPQSIVH
ncbi:MAG: hypothetical protein R2809_13615 [Flavobacteriales bacterium]